MRKIIPKLILVVVCCILSSGMVYGYWVGRLDTEWEIKLAYETDLYITNIPVETETIITDVEETDVEDDDFSEEDINDDPSGENNGESDTDGENGFEPDETEQSQPPAESPVEETGGHDNLNQPEESGLDSGAADSGHTYESEPAAPAE